MLTALRKKSTGKCVVVMPTRSAASWALGTVRPILQTPLSLAATIQIKMAKALHQNRPLQKYNQITTIMITNSSRSKVLTPSRGRPMNPEEDSRERERLRAEWDKLSDTEKQQESEKMYGLFEKLKKNGIFKIQNNPFDSSNFEK